MARPISDSVRDFNSAALPIACTLGAGQGAERLTRWRTLLETSLLEVRREPDRIVARVTGTPGAAAELDALVAAERVCCSFVEWHVVHDERCHELQVRGSREGLDAIAAIFTGG